MRGKKGKMAGLDLKNKKIKFKEYSFFPTKKKQIKNIKINFRKREPSKSLLYLPVLDFFEKNKIE